MRKELFVFLVCWLFAVDVYSRIIPVSVSEVQIDFNGQISTAQQFQFICSHLNSDGFIRVGTYSIYINCKRPFVEYQMKEVARVPQEIRLVWDKACLVDNIQSALTSLGLSDQELSEDFIGPSRRLFSVTVVNGGSRLATAGGLVFGAAGVIMGAVALNRIDKLTESIEAINTWKEATDSNLLKMSDDILELAEWKKVQEGLTADNNKKWQNQTQINDNFNYQLRLSALSQNASDTAILNLTAGTNKAFDKLRSDISTTQLDFQNRLDRNQNASNTAILNLASAFSSSVTQVQNQINLLNARVNEGTIANANAQKKILDAIYEVQYKNLLTASIFAHLDALPDRFKPLFEDYGLRPRELIGAELRTAIDTININFRSTPTVGGVYQIYRYTFKIYMSSEFAMENMMTSAPSWRSVFTSMGPTSNCQRPYVDPQSDPDPSNEVKCQTWIEVNREVCSRNTAGFNWATANPAIPPNEQTGELLALYCSSPPVIGFNGVNGMLVLRTVGDVMKFMNEYVCSLRGSSAMSGPEYKFMAISNRRYVLGYFQGSPTSTCGMGVDEMFDNMKTTNNGHILLTFMNMIWTARQFANSDILDARMKKYGRLPSLEPFAVPWSKAQQVNGTYDASGDPARCLKAEYLVATSETLEVNSFQAKRGSNGQWVQKEVEIQITNSQPCDPLDSGCYEVRKENIALNIPSTQDFPFPLDDFTIVGSFDPARASSLGMYDVPESMISLTTHPYGRKDSVTYYKMPPGTLVTQEVSDWIEDNSGLFNPEMGAISPSDFRFATLLDPDGYVMCDVPGGVLANVNKTLPQKCSLGMQWNNGSSRLSNCVTLPNSVVIFNTWQDSKQKALYGTNAIANSIATGSNSLFSFWFQSSLTASIGSVNVVLQITASNGFLRFIVDSSGVPAVLFSTSITSNLNSTLRFDTRTRLNTGNLRDASLHHIIWRISNSSTVNSYTLWTDNMLIGTFTTSVALVGPFSVRNSELDFPAYANPNGASNSDTIELGLFQPITTAAQITGLRNTIDSMYTCQMTAIRQRCSKSGEVVILDAVEAQKSGCNGTRMAVTTQTPIQGVPSTAFPAGGSWSVGFWVRVPWSQASVSSGASFENYMTITRNQMNITVSWSNSNNAGRLRISLNSQIIGTLNILLSNSVSESHHVTIAYSGSSAQVALYLDGTPQVTATLTRLLSGLAASIQLTSDYIFMVSYYSSTLSATRALDEINSCHLSSSSQAIRDYLAPVGSCVLPSSGSSVGYCRHSSLCDGHCIAYSSIASNGEFVVGSSVCDAGYKAPECLKKCEYQDASGYCIDFQGGYATGFTPNGKACVYAKHFAIKTNAAAEFATFESREFLLTPTITIPTGKITVVAGGTATCPNYTPYDQGDGGLAIALQNTQGEPAQIRVFFYPWDYQATPKQCNANCCNYNRGGLLLTIPAFGSQIASIPQCGNTTVEIGIQVSSVQFKTCSVLTGTSLLAAVAASGQSLPLSLQANVDVRVNEATRGIYGIYQSESIAQYTLLQEIASEAKLSTGIQNAIYQAKSLVENQTPASWNFTSFNSSGTDVAPGLEADLQRNRDRLNTISILQEEVRLQNEGIKNLTAENEKTIKDAAVRFNNTIENVMRTRASILLAAAIKIPIPDSGFDFVGWVGETAKKAVNVVESPFEKAFSGLGLGSSLSGFLDGILNALISLCFIAIIVYVVYWLYKRSKMNSTEPLTEEEKPSRWGWKSMKITNKSKPADATGSTEEQGLLKEKSKV